LNSSRKSPSRKGKWLVQNRLKYKSLLENKYKNRVVI